MRFFTIFFLLVSITITSKGQQCSGLGATPATSLAICGSTVSPQTNVPPCTGPDLPGTSCFDAVTTSSSVWYHFHCYQNGTFGFLINPASPADDYDWAIMDITGHAPSDALTMNLVISLNISGVTGSTGCTAAGTSNTNCSGTFTSPYNSMPVLQAGHDYLLMVTNWSNSGLGFDLGFSGGTVDITNASNPPSISAATVVGCDGSRIKITFPQELECNSLTATSSEFTISNGANTFTSISSVCSTAGTFTELILTLQNPVPPGNYQLTVQNGNPDNNTLLNTCGIAIPVGTSVPLNVPSALPPVIKNVDFTGCAPSVLKVVLDKPVLCSSITSAALNSEFSLSPGNHQISSIISTCSTGRLFTDTILVVFQDRLPFGNYQLKVGNGADGNSFLDTCGNFMITGYQFPFVINQTTIAPVIQSVDFDECKPFKLVVNFNKPVDCNSFTNGDEFSISPGTYTISTVQAFCSAGSPSFATKFEITLTDNLPAGNFNVLINHGSDLNTLSDTCFSFIPLNYSKAFTTTQAPAPVYDSVQYDKCAPSVIKVFYSQPINCSSFDVSGSEFSITGPTPVAITSVSGNPATCSAGYSKWLLLNLDQQINNLGTYVLHNIAGADGNSVMDTCYAIQKTAETISFNVLGIPSAGFNDLIKWGCVEDTIVLSHPGGNAVNSWEWSFSDNTTTSGQSVSHVFPVTTISATVQLVVFNGNCRDTLKRTYQLNNVFNADFTASADSICINSNIKFTNNSNSNAVSNSLQYLWDFGDNTTFNGQIPQVHSYSLNNNYDVNLYVTDSHGCKDTATKTVIVTPKPVVDFSGLKTQYCTGDTVSLVSNIQGYIDNYTWNNGNSGIFNNQPLIKYTYALQNNYNISLAITDRFCGVFEKKSSVQVYRVPGFEFGDDRSLCPGLTIKIGTATLPGYTYLWSNGQTSSQITTVLQSSLYKLTVDNNGCISEDKVFIEMLDHCLIKVPGAFTPNGDGVNDKLKAINADLATNFLLKVYNRFGQLMFSTRNPLAGWDGLFKGNPADTGTYVWLLNYIDPTSRKPVSEKGTSLLLR